MKNSKKLVNLISLVVLVATNILSPLSYATAGEEDIGSVSDTVSYGAEQGSGGESPAEASEGSDNNESSGTEGRNLGDAEEDTQDSSATPQNDEGDVDNPSEPHPTPLLIGEGSPDEIGTGEVDNETPIDSSADKSSSGGQDEVDNGTGEKSAIDELKELIENEENSIQIVESEEIYGTGEYEGVKVEVYAQTGAFPLGTILNIIPITGDDEMRDIQDVLEEQKNVEKSQKVIAFDITFLSPETEEELQPSITGSVQVTFNYEENDELVAAEEDEEQDIQIFHINDKDENGERIKNITGNIVEDVVVNKEATEKIENTVVINAESFSIYAIVNGNENPELVATLVGDDNTRNNFKYRTITISDGTTTYTIMDRNLGAKEVWDGTRGLTTDDSYGYYYSWGKNYGHITAPSSSNNFTPSDVPSWDSVCPNGWKPLTERYSIYNVRKNSNSETDLGSEEKNFMYDLRIPPAGILEYNWGFKFSGRGSRAYFIKNDDGRDTFYYYISDSEHGSSDINHWNALSPIRCIKNSANSIFNVTFDSNGGSDVEGQVITQGSLIIEPEEPTKDGYTFAGWYTSDDGGQTLSDTAFDFDELITENITLYAKWDKDCGTGVYFEEMDVCATRDSNNIVYYWTDEKGNGVISIKDPNGNTILTMLDKNEGASVAGLGEDSYGELYQRGNNAPIKTAPTSTDRAEYKNYWPGHSFYDATFRYGSSMEDYWQNASADNDTHYDNLWGGDRDYYSTSWGGLNNGSTRQGPCPAGYHVPSMGEWNEVLRYFATNPNVNQQITPSNEFNRLLSDSARIKFQSVFMLPYTGYRKNGTITYDSEGRYWTSSPFGGNSRSSARILYFDKNSVRAGYGNNRVLGNVVRCFKDSSDVANTIILTFDENGGDLLGAEGENGEGTLIQKVESGKQAQEPVSPTKDGATFQGWTTERDGNTVFNFSNPVTTSRTLYAKWESICPDGEEYVEDKCIPSRAIIRDSVSGEIIQINDMEWDDLELYFLKSDGSTGHYTIMDRNMGATEVYNQNQDDPNFESLGYHYQRGNNYGFKPCEGNECSTFPGGETAGNIVIEKSVWEAYAPSKYARNTWSTADNWMGGARDNDNLRGGAGDEKFSDGPGTGGDRQGPCPDEYHIPSAYEWNQMSNAWEDAVSTGFSFTKGVIFDSDFLMPSAGYRSSSTHAIYGILFAHYWSSSPWSSGEDGMRLYVNGGPGVSNLDRSNGLSIRCMKNTNNADTLQIHANGGTGAVIAFTGSVSNGRFTSLGTPRKGNAVFLGWYDAPVDGNKLEIGSAVVPDIYARWNCDNGYVDNGTVCVAGVTVSFLSGDHGTLSGTTEYVIFSGSKLSDIEGFSIPTPVDNAKYVFSGWNPAVNINESITSDKTYIATWRPINDKNNNGIADEDEEHFTLEFTGGTNGTLSGQRIWLDVLTGLTIDEAGIIIPEVIPNSGYMFSGWNPEITGGTVITSGMTLTPIYGEDNNGDGQNDEFETKYTVIYKDGVDGVEIFADQKTENILSGTATPAFVGTPTRENYVFSGWTPAVAEKVTSNATYSAQWKADMNNDGQADETEDRYTVTVTYVYSRGGTASQTYSLSNQLSGFTYDVDSPIIPNYHADKTNVSGTVTGNVNEVVTYTPNNDANGDGYADEGEDTYKITVYYNYSRGGKAAETQSGEYLSGIDYSFTSPIIDYYTPSIEVISGTTTGIVDYTVVYSPIKDLNGDGYADEEETPFTVKFLPGEHGTLGGVTEFSVLSGLKLSEIEGYQTPTTIPNTHYVFSGWSPKLNTNIKVLSNITYTAIWGEDNNGDGQNDEFEIKYTVIYKDGVDGVEIFADQKTENILSGTATPAFVGTPTRENYVFSGWTPAVAEKVTSNATYSAQWKVDTNNNGVADEDETYALTINYVYSKGGTAADSHVGYVLKGVEYSVTSPSVTNYETIDTVVSGTMPGEAKTVTVTYTPIHDTNNNNIADEEEIKYTLTIQYHDKKGNTVYDDYTGQYVAGAHYERESQPKEYYTIISGAIVSGTMPADNLTLTVVYEANLDANDNGIADQDETKYTLTIHYVNAKGGKLYDDYTGEYVAGAPYNVVSDTSDTNYTIESGKETVSGTMPAQNQTLTVVYTAKTDANGNGIADEDETSDFHTLTIHYVNSKGATLFSDHVESIVKGATYTVNSPSKDHYTIDRPIVSGTMGDEDVTETVVYNTETADTNDNGIADEDETPHVLTIMYRYSRDKQAHEPVIASYLSGISYSVTSPIIANYTADKLVVKGIMGEENKIVIVTYSPDEDENHDGYADALETKYTVTVHYEYSRGGVAHADNVEQDVLSGLSYSITSPTIAHYTASKQIISGIVTGVNIEETVVYTPVNDANGDGYADEDETKYTVIYTDGVDNEVIFADQKTENILSGTATPAFVGTPTRENYIFSGWTPNVAPKVTKNATYTARWKEDFNHNGIDDATELHYTLTIHYVNGSGGKVYDDYIGSYVSGVNYTVTSPLRTYYTIQTGGEVISGVMGTGNIEKTVVYIANHDTNGNGIADEEEVVPTPSGGGSSGGGGKKMPTTDTHGSAIDKDTQDSTNKDTEDVKDSLEDKKGEEKIDLNIDNDSKGGVTDNGAWQSSDSSSQGQGSSSSSSVSYTQEQVEAYTFAKANGITTKSSIEEAKMNTTLTRIQMAKMLSNFAINVLGEAPDTSKSINFKDVSSKKDKEYDNGVTLAYQLGIMGQNMKNNEFRPNDEVTRGEFASALSRLLYNTPEGEYKSTGKYYVPHITKLYNEGIINKAEPKLKEKRGYVMLMLMRSVK